MLNAIQKQIVGRVELTLQKRSGQGDTDASPDHTGHMLALNSQA